MAATRDRLVSVARCCVELEQADAVALATGRIEALRENAEDAEGEVNLLVVGVPSEVSDGEVVVAGVEEGGAGRGKRFRVQRTEDDTSRPWAIGVRGWSSGVPESVQHDAIARWPWRSRG